MNSSEKGLIQAIGIQMQLEQTTLEMQMVYNPVDLGSEFQLTPLLGYSWLLWAWGLNPEWLLQQHGLGFCLLCMCVDIFPACLLVYHVYTWSLWRPEEGIRFPWVACMR